MIHRLTLLLIFLFSIPFVQPYCMLLDYP
jgi:hypothetical protein